MGYWLKSYTDILDDPKYFKLSTNAQLAMHECFLIAKKLESDELTGMLPSLDEIAFHSRKPIDFWIEAIKELINVGIIIEKDDGYIIKNYVKRQQAISDGERARQYRKRRNDNRMSENDNDTQTPQTDNGQLTNRDGEKRRVEKEKSREEKEVEKEVKNHDHNPLTNLLFSTFSSETGISSSMNQDDVTVLNRLINAGATQADLMHGIEYMRTNNFPIVGIKSVLNPTIVEISKRKVKNRAPDEDDYQRFSRGKYAGHIKS